MSPPAGGRGWAAQRRRGWAIRHLWITSPLALAAKAKRGHLWIMPQLDPRPTKRAQELRNNATDAERRLWHHLSRRQLEGFKFSRQIPVGPFICDFLCRERMVAVELDGSQHAEDPRDVRRTAYLEAKGYGVVRFWNHDVLDNIDGVLAVILGELRDRASRFQSPLPLAGGEEVRSTEGVGTDSPQSPTPQPPPASGRGSLR